HSEIQEEDMVARFGKGHLGIEHEPDLLAQSKGAAQSDEQREAVVQAVHAAEITVLTAELDAGIPVLVTIKSRVQSQGDKEQGAGVVRRRNVPVDARHRKVQERGDALGVGAEDARQERRRNPDSQAAAEARVVLEL